MNYEKSHVLALFEWEPLPFIKPDNVAVQINEAGRKEVFEDQSKKVALEKGKNKIEIGFYDYL